MTQDMALPLQTVGEAAAAELTGETLLYDARPRAAAGAADGRCKDLWEMEFKRPVSLRTQ